MYAETEKNVTAKINPPIVLSLSDTIRININIDSQEWLWAHFLLLNTSSTLLPQKLMSAIILTLTCVPNLILEDHIQVSIMIWGLYASITP